MKYLDYCLVTRTIDLHENRKVQIPVLAQFIIERPELKKFLVIKSTDIFLAGRYEEVTNLIMGDEVSIRNTIKTNISKIENLIDELKQKKEESLKKCAESSKESVIEGEIKNLKAKIDSLNVYEPEDFAKMQVYLKEIKNQEKGLKREDKRIKAKSRNTTSSYDYDIEILKREINDLNYFLKIMKNHSNLKARN